MTTAQTLWGPVTCVPVRDIPTTKRRAVRLPYGFWQDLVHEVRLRLEQTPAREALCIPFHNRELAARARATLYQHYLNDIGPGAIRLRLVTLDGQPVLFAWRGPQWTR